MNHNPAHARPAQGVKVTILWHDEAMNDGTPGYIMDIETPDGDLHLHARNVGTLVNHAERWCSERGMRLGYFQIIPTIPGKIPEESHA